jgi:Carboxypeptidase regulatory-like domain/Bacterial Ig-like domain (group 2)
MKRMSLVFAAIVLAAACGSNPVSTTAPTPVTPSPQPPVPPTLVAMTVDGPAAIVSSAQMTASAHYSDGSTRDVTSLASWESSAPPFATVSSTGAVTAVATGSTEVRATYQNFVGTMRVAVTKTPVTFVLTGIVRDASTQQPLAGVELHMIGDAAGRTTTNAVGEYRLAGLPGLRILVEFTRSGYELLEISVTMTGDQSRDVSLDAVKR